MLKGWRTIVVNMLVIMAAGLDSVANSGTQLSNENAALIVAMVSVVNLVMRLFTTTPVGKKPQQ